MTKGSRRGCITLKKAIVGIDDEDNCTFTIHSEGHTYHFQGEGVWSHQGQVLIPFSFSSRCRREGEVDQSNGDNDIAS